MAKEYKLDLFGLLNQLDRKNFKAFDELPPESKKEASPLIIMRWLSGTSDQRQIIFLNELVNQVVFELGEHKQLLFKLLAIANSGKPRRYFWSGLKSNTRKNLKVSTALISEYYKCSFTEAQDYLKILSKEDVLQIAEKMGCQKEQIQIIKKEL
jgi:hypothetical protein